MIEEMRLPTSGRAELATDPKNPAFQLPSVGADRPSGTESVGVVC